MGLFGGGDFKVTTGGFFGSTKKSGLTEQSAHSYAQNLSRDGKRYYVVDARGNEVASYKNGR